MLKLKWLLIGVYSVLSTSAIAQEYEVSFNEYGDWRARVVQIESEEETWRECTASTGGDGSPSLAISAHQYDAKPPDYYLPIEIREYAIRNHDTVMQEGGLVSFVFDTGELFQGVAQTWIDDGAYKVASVSPTHDVSLNVLQAMRRSGTLNVFHEGRLLMSFSLGGFAAAYGKIAEGCNFSTTGVLESASIEAIGDAGGNRTLFLEQFGVWRTQADEFADQGSMILECFASVGMDTERSLSFGINSLEGSPPVSFPPLILSQAIAEAAVPMASNGSRIQFAFDTGLVLPGDVMTDTVFDGLRYIDLAVQPGYRDLALREMRRGRMLWVYADGVVIYQSALDGFVQAYTAIARVCDFTTKGVLD